MQIRGSGTLDQGSATEVSRKGENTWIQERMRVISRGGSGLEGSDKEGD